MKLTRTFNTILRSNQIVNQAALRFSTPITRKSTEPLPESFNPLEHWVDFLSPIKDQGSCGNCWAQSCVDCLSDRFSIQTLGQVYPNLSSYEITICDGVIGGDIKLDQELESNAHSSAACTGNTIYNALNFLYMYGAMTEECFDNNILIKKGYNLEKNIKTSEDLPYCLKLLGNDFNNCLDEKTPARFYRSVASYNINQNVDDIKYEIYKWGPVVSGMKVYSNFLKYDGLSIYKGPGDKDTEEGGHAIRIIGWGIENGINYWWIANSWGVDWGTLGYFRMAMNIEKCELEKNVASMIPDIPTITKDDMETKVQTYFGGDSEKRKWFGVDNNTGYKYSSLKKFKDEGISVPSLFVNEWLPDYKTFWAGKIKRHPRLLIYHQQPTTIFQTCTQPEYIILVFLICFPLLVAYVLSKKK